MMDATTIPANTVSFRDFLFKDKRNRTILILAAVAMVIQWGVFKWFYPFANYIHDDSFIYIDGAIKNYDVNNYLVGYSKFLRLINIFTNSDLALTFIQYLMLQTSSLFLLFILFYFYNLSKFVQNTLFVFIVLNPLFLHLGNLVSSDGVFVAVSFAWFGLLIWILNKPDKRLVFLQTLLLLILFTIRYNALIYPFIASIAFILSKMNTRMKTAGIALGIIGCTMIVMYSGYMYKRLTGKWQFSPFSGWQLANNGMYAYRYVNKEDRKPVPEKFRELDNMIRTYFDNTRDVSKHPQEALQASTIYMWSPGLPLFNYMDMQFKNNPRLTKRVKWASMGPLYKEYGTWLILSYPQYFIRYFMWPNASKYFAPPVEYLEYYNGRGYYVKPSAQKWFGYKSQQITTRTNDLKSGILDFYPILSGVMNLLMLCGLLCYFLSKDIRSNLHFRKAIIIWCTFWLTNAGFTIFASSAALRFQSFPILLTAVFSLILIDWIYGISTINKESNKLVPESINKILDATPKVAG